MVSAEVSCYPAQFTLAALWHELLHHFCQDCFVFPRSWIPCLSMGEFVFGIGRWGDTMVAQLRFGLEFILEHCIYFQLMLYPVRCSAAPRPVMHPRKSGLAKLRYCYTFSSYRRQCAVSSQSPATHRLSTKHSLSLATWVKEVTPNPVSLVRIPGRAIARHRHITTNGI